MRGVSRSDFLCFDVSQGTVRALPPNIFPELRKVITFEDLCHRCKLDANTSLSARGFVAEPRKFSTQEGV